MFIIVHFWLRSYVRSIVNSPEQKTVDSDIRKMIIKFWLDQSLYTVVFICEEQMCNQISLSLYCELPDAIGSASCCSESICV